MLIFCTFLQLVLAATGWFYRYEAYLMLSSCYIVPVIVYQYRGELTGRLRQYPLAAAFIMLMLFLPMCSRSVTAFRKASLACANIYDQQFQMARFLHTFCHDDQVVAVNDIGAVSLCIRRRRTWNFGAWPISKSPGVKRIIIVPPRSWIAWPGASMRVSRSFSMSGSAIPY